MSSIESTVRRNMVRSLVQRDITCNYTGQILDMDTCAVLIDADGDPFAVLAPEAADVIEANPDAVAKIEALGYRLARGGRSAVS